MRHYKRNWKFIIQLACWWIFKKVKENRLWHNRRQREMWESDKDRNKHVKFIRTFYFTFPSFAFLYTLLSLSLVQAGTFSCIRRRHTTSETAADIYYFDSNERNTAEWRDTATTHFDFSLLLDTPSPYNNCYFLIIFLLFLSRFFLCCRRRELSVEFRFPPFFASHFFFLLLVHIENSGNRKIYVF